MAAEAQEHANSGTDVKPALFEKTIEVTPAPSSHQNHVRDNAVSKYSKHEQRRQAIVYGEPREWTRKIGTCHCAISSISSNLTVGLGIGYA
jgi:hypothetical protein